MKIVLEKLGLILWLQIFCSRLNYCDAASCCWKPSSSLGISSNSGLRNRAITPETTIYKSTFENGIDTQIGRNLIFPRVTGKKYFSRKQPLRNSITDISRVNQIIPATATKYSSLQPRPGYYLTPKPINNYDISQKLGHYVGTFTSYTPNPWTQVISSKATAMSTSECTAMEDFTSDLGIVSLLLSALSWVIGVISLWLSNYFNVFGSGLAVIFVGVPTLIANVATLFHVGPSSTSPIATILTIKSIMDSLNNLFSIVPGSLFSDFVGLISLVIGKISLAISIVTTYPKLLEAIVRDNYKIRWFVKTAYGCL